MEPLYIIALILAGFALLAIFFGLGEKSKRKECDQLRLSLCDTYQSLDEYIKKYQLLKKNYWKIQREYVELSNANKLMRKANEEIAEEYFNKGNAIGIKEGYEKAWKEVGDQLIKESVVLKEGSIVKEKIMPHQLVDVKC